MPCFQVLDAEGADGETWRRIWSLAVVKEVFWHPAYCRLFASKPGEHAKCAVLPVDGGYLLFPFILRDLSGERFWAPDLGARFDITSPYGYGGPFRSDPATRSTGFAALWSALADWAGSLGVVSEFVRFSLSPDSSAGYHGDVLPKGKNVVRSLDLDDDAIWMDFEHKVRKNVKRAQRAGVSVEIATEPTRMDDFLRIYHSTLVRRSASDGYFFDRDFLETLNRETPDSVAYGHALVDGRVVSTELVLVSDSSIYSFLGGTDKSAFALRPNDLLKFEIIMWARRKNKQRFVLGGGYQPQDGIFKYKKAFAPKGIVEFFVGNKVYDPIAYDLLTRRHLERDAEGIARSTGFFPAYRLPIRAGEDGPTAG